MAPEDSSPITGQPAKSSPLDPIQTEKEIWAWAEWYHEKYGYVPDWMLQGIPNIKNFQEEFLAKHGSISFMSGKSFGSVEPWRSPGKNDIAETYVQAQSKARRKENVAQSPIGNHTPSNALRYGAQNKPQQGGGLTIRKPMVIVKDY